MLLEHKSVVIYGASGAIGGAVRRTAEGGSVVARRIAGNTVGSRALVYYSDTDCAEVTPASEFIDPHPRPDRLEAMRSEPGSCPQRRRRVFRRAAGCAAAGRAAGAHPRLGHSL